MVGVGRIRNVSRINVNKIALQEEAATKIAKCWRGYQARTELSNVKETLATIAKESQENNRQIAFNYIHHSYKQILGLNEAGELVAKQHASLYAEDAIAITKKLKTCAAKDKPVEEAFKNVIFKDIRSYEEFLKTLPADKRTDPTTQRIGKLPFEMPGFEDKIAEFMDSTDESIKHFSLKIASKDIKFHFLGSGMFGDAYSFKVGDKKYVLKAFANRHNSWINQKTNIGGVDQSHGYLAETNRLVYLKEKHPELAQHFAHFHYADLGRERKFAISEYVEKANVEKVDVDYDNLQLIGDKLDAFGFVLSDGNLDNVHGSKIIDAGGIYINNYPKYPYVNYFNRILTCVNKSESGDRIIVDTHKANLSTNAPLVVSVPRPKSARVSKLADPRHPLHQQYLRYAGQSYTKPAHISVFVPQTPPASK